MHPAWSLISPGRHPAICVPQVRGSIPLYWSQQGSRLSKPDILLQTFDPLYRCAICTLYRSGIGRSVEHLLPNCSQTFLIVLLIVVNSATRAHFEDLRERYGSPLVCLNLVKAVEKRPREVVLRTEFDTAISYINQTVRCHSRHTWS